MAQGYFGNYGVNSGYGQPTAGRDAAQPEEEQGQPGRPRTAAPQAQPQAQPAQAGIGMGQAAQPFKGAMQTIGAQAKYPGTTHGSMDQLDGQYQQGQAAGQNMDWMKQRTHGGPGFDGAPNWMGNAMGAAPVARGPQAIPSQTGRYEQGGIAGAVPAAIGVAQAAVPGAAGQKPAPEAPASPYQIPDSVYSTAAPSGWDPAKWADPNKHDAKYDMRRVLNDLDPKQGWTPEALARVNSLGYGTFTSDGGDGLNLSGLTDAGRKAGLSGDYQGADFINGFKGDHPTWGYADPAAEAAQGGGAPAALSPELLAMLGGGGGMSQQSAVPQAAGAPAGDQSQFNSERMRAMIMQALQGGQTR